MEINLFYLSLSIYIYIYILNKSWWQHPTRHQLYGHLPPITKTIQVRQTRHAGHCWRSKDELISDVLLWTPAYGQAKAGRPARTYIQQLYEDTGCSPEDLPEAMKDRKKWRENVRDIRASGTTWWWWWWHIYTIRRIWSKRILRTPVNEIKKREEKGRLRIRNKSLFVFERFRLLIQMKSILYFMSCGIFYSFFSFHWT